MQKRTLTITFERSVTAGTPNTMEVTVTPLAVTTNPTDGTVLVGGPQTQTVLLDNETNTITFDLVPSDHEDLFDSIPYRIAWRERYTGHQYTTDFTMPDVNTDFADLAPLGRIIRIL